MELLPPERIVIQFPPAAIWLLFSIFLYGCRILKGAINYHLIVGCLHKQVQVYTKLGVFVCMCM